jgi:hypothetical protein
LKHKVQYDPLTHTYRVNGKRLPSVTEIIQTVLPRKWNASDFDLRKGTMVHKALALHMAGCLEIDTVDPRIVDRVNAGIMAAKAFGWMPAMIEPPMAHDIMQYAGTPDMITQCGCIVDWKGSEQETTGLQLGGYGNLAKVNGITIRRLYEVTTGDNGYKVKEYDLRRHMGLWVALYGVYGWMHEH